MSISEEELLNLKEELSYMKEQNLQLAKMYGSELCSNDMERAEKVLENKISLLEKDLIIKKYLNSGGKLFVITDMQIIRDGGTMEIITNKGKYYIDQDRKNIHNGYVPTTDNIINDDLLKFYLIDRIESYITHLEEKAKGLRFFLSRFKGNTGYGRIPT